MYIAYRVCIHNLRVKFAPKISVISLNSLNLVMSTEAYFT